MIQRRIALVGQRSAFPKVVHGFIGSVGVLRNQNHLHEGQSQPKTQGSEEADVRRRRET